jgi:hypothetical protein
MLGWESIYTSNVGINMSFPCMKKIEMNAQTIDIIQRMLN